MHIESAIADGVRQAHLPIEEESHVIDHVIHAVTSVPASDVLRDLVDDLGREEVQRRLDALS
jgi:hypothetical protein